MVVCRPRGYGKHWMGLKIEFFKESEYFPEKMKATVISPIPSILSRLSPSLFLGHYSVLAFHRPLVLVFVPRSLALLLAVILAFFVAVFEKGVTLELGLCAVCLSTSLSSPACLHPMVAIPSIPIPTTSTLPIPPPPPPLPLPRLTKQPILPMITTRHPNPPAIRAPRPTTIRPKSLRPRLPRRPTPRIRAPPPHHPQVLRLIAPTTRGHRPHHHPRHLLTRRALQHTGAVGAEAEAAAAAVTVGRITDIHLRAPPPTIILLHTHTPLLPLLLQGSMPSEVAEAEAERSPVEAGSPFPPAHPRLHCPRRRSMVPLVPVAPSEEAPGPRGRCPSR